MQLRSDVACESEYTAWASETLDDCPEIWNLCVEHKDELAEKSKHGNSHKVKAHLCANLVDRSMEKFKSVYTYHRV